MQYVVMLMLTGDTRAWGCGAKQASTEKKHTFPESNLAANGYQAIQFSQVKNQIIFLDLDILENEGIRDLNSACALFMETQGCNYKLRMFYTYCLSEATNVA